MTDTFYLDGESIRSSLRLCYVVTCFLGFFPSLYPELFESS